MPEILDRAPFGWLRERDIDLLLCAELHAKSELENFIASQVLAGPGQFDGAWVSVAEQEGETDVMVAWNRPKGRVLALIENKISAAFQPNQGLRYQARAERWASENGFAAAVTVLFAPETYLNDDEALLFDVHITYEETFQVMRSGTDPRARFFADALESGVAALSSVYSAVPSEDVTETWLAIWETARENQPRLKMKHPGSKPGRSTWIYFRDAKGLQKLHGKSISLVFKAERGQADLMFSSTSPAELENIRFLLEPDMQIEQAAKSASIRILVPKIDFVASAVSQFEGIQAGLSACERLRTVFAQHTESFLQVLAPRAPSASELKML